MSILHDRINYRGFVEQQSTFRPGHWFFNPLNHNWWTKDLEPAPIVDGFGREYNSEGLRYVSPEVGWVDQDEEYY